MASFGVVPFIFLLLIVESSARPFYPLPSKMNHKNRQPLQTFRPYNIAHRGSNGELPEETAAAYMKAIEEGADFIETDILASKDGALICFHDVILDDTTDIADLKKFANRKRTYDVQGVNITGHFTVDFTLKELKSLRVKQRYPYRDQQYNDKHHRNSRNAKFMPWVADVQLLGQLFHLEIRMQISGMQGARNIP